MSTQNSICSHTHNDHNGVEKAPVIVVMVPFPLQSHLNQLLQLSHLISSYNIPVHYVGSTFYNSQVRSRSRIHADPANIHFHDFPTPPFTSEYSSSDFLFPSFHATKHLREPVSALLHQLSSKAKRLIIINDVLSASVVQDAQTLPNAKSYIFYSVSAFDVFTHIWEAMGKPFQLEAEIIPSELPSLQDCVTPESLRLMTDQYQFVGSKAGELYNTTRSIEATYVDLLRKVMNGNGKIWAIGPLLPTITSSEWEKRDQIVRSTAISKAVKTLMATDEGKEMRKRARDMGSAVQRSTEEGGVSRMEWDSFIAHITS
ncbi:hypothetical protein FEM48_Zijuj12G0023700 [Ziziphus jujuba var. spinosa]|uniref:Glycosyltransferase N-terminal domain-containing protein n=1 Tax=Ziziphus jujuba var. spinosa TaxID=714518 RepID=A0A978UAN3_ZIZJJ|nr:hypothetical protein FEM48_Zijuj12G0023700 [Ziziphus jujuba var. spinosa]